MSTATTAATTNLILSDLPLANVLGDTFRSRHASRVSQANDVIDTLIGRGHAPEPGDEEAAVDAVMELVALGQPYSAERFALDCAAAIEIRTLLSDARASEAERDKLMKEAKKIRREIATVHGPKMPNISRPIDIRLRDTLRQIVHLDAQHAAWHVRFNKLADAMPRVLRALISAGSEARLKQWAPSLAIPPRINWRVG